MKNISDGDDGSPDIAQLKTISLASFSMLVLLAMITIGISGEKKTIRQCSHIVISELKTSLYLIAMKTPINT